MRPVSSLRRRAVVVAASLFVAALAGCDYFGSGKSGIAFKNADITGSPGFSDAKNFRLSGHDGKTYGLDDFKGKVVVVFFGYTQCPDVCPTDLLQLAQVKKKLGPEGAKLQVLFITIDPERDTRAVLAQYVTAFDPSFIGLYGDAQATARTAKAFKAFYQKVPGSAPGVYSMEHTAGSYVFDKSGQLRLFVRFGQDDDALQHDLKALIEE